MEHEDLIVSMKGIQKSFGGVSCSHRWGTYASQG